MRRGRAPLVLPPGPLFPGEKGPTAPTTTTASAAGRAEAATTRSMARYSYSPIHSFVLEPILVWRGLMLAVVDPSLAHLSHEMTSASAWVKRASEVGACARVRKEAEKPARSPRTRLFGKLNSGTIDRPLA